MMINLLSFLFFPSAKKRRCGEIVENPRKTMGFSKSGVVGGRAETVVMASGGVRIEAGTIRQRAVAVGIRA
jgi:hypothetical protein